MASAAAIKTLIEVSNREVEDAARKLSEASRHVVAMEEKLVLLDQYRVDYTDRFKAGSALGVQAGDYRNYQSFLDKLGAAVAGQTELLRSARRSTDGPKDAWLAALRKQKSFEALAVRADIGEQKRESRRDQRSTDEHASRKTGPLRRP